MLICIGTESQFLHHDLRGLRFELLLLLFLLIEELLVIYHTATRRVGARRNLHQIKLQPVCDLHGFPDGIYAGIFDVVTYHPDTGRGDSFIDSVLGLSFPWPEFA